MLQKLLVQLLCASQLALFALARDVSFKLTSEAAVNIDAGADAALIDDDKKKLVGDVDASYCSAEGIQVLSVDLTENGYGIYDFQFQGVGSDSQFWVGLEAEGDTATGYGPIYAGGSASVYISTVTDSPICFVNSRFSLSVEGISLVVGTFADGTVWGQIVDDTVEVPEIEVEPEASPDGYADVEADDGGSAIDLLMTYSAEAMCSNAGLPFPCEATQANKAAMLNRINFLVQEANSILKNSGLTAPLTVNLKHAYLAEDYDEELGYSATLRAMLEPDDGVFEQPSLLNLRDQFCADIVGVIVLNPDNDLNAIGLATLGPGTNAFRFLSALTPDAVSRATFTHELGHILVRKLVCFVVVRCPESISSNTNDALQLVRDVDMN